MTSVSAKNPLAGEIDGRQRRADQQEHQRVGEKGGKLPEFEHERPPMRSDRKAEPLLIGMSTPRLPIVIPATTLARTPEAPKCSAIRNEPKAATTVSAVSTR